ncbi:MAG: DUF2911 domain-containing protein [Chitinophagaceae bacterium]|nr:MAG: DUF2911 domain-containing protein [Chitinophagaceae bacterium]
MLPKLLRTVFLCLPVVALCCCNGRQQEKPATATGDTLKLAPTNGYVTSDQSPMDISYYPTEFPQHKMAADGKEAMPVARVIYSRPHKKGRQIFGNSANSLCVYGRPWRLGANEATEIEFFVPVLIDGQNVPAGRYILYCIPFSDKWTLALNRNIDSWGLAIDSSKDVLRTELPVMQQAPPVEDFTMVFKAASTGADLIMAWDGVRTVLPLTFTQ